jgi:hypothetical protein
LPFLLERRILASTIKAGMDSSEGSESRTGLPSARLALSAIGTMLSVQHSPPAPGLVVQDLFAQQRSNSAMLGRVTSELENLAAIDMALAAAEFLAADDAAAGAMVAGAGAAHTIDKCASLHDLAYHALVTERGNSKHDGDGRGEEAVWLSNDAAGPSVKKRSRKSLPAPVLEEVQAESGDEESGSGGLTVLQIKEFYDKLYGTTITDRSQFQIVMQQVAKKHKVSITSMRNIVSFKNRTADSHPFWNDALWDLYHRWVRCEQCRDSSGNRSRVLCTHFKIGRPAAKNTHKQLAAEKFSTDSAATHKDRKRNYLLQIRLQEVWACLGCEHSKKYLLSKKCDLDDPTVAGAPLAGK